MTVEYKKFYSTIDDIDLKILRKDNWCWIKVEPIKQMSSPSSLHIILNDEEHHWDIYDESKKVAHIVYFKGINCIPCFYLKSGDKCFRVDFGLKGIKVVSIDVSHRIDAYLKKNCFCKSSEASCWAKSVYYTSRPDKTPFDLM